MVFKGKTLIFLVDTGAARTILRTKDFYNLEGKRLNRKHRIQGIAGQLVEVYDGLIEIGIGQALETMEVLVARVQFNLLGMKDLENQQWKIEGKDYILGMTTILQEITVPEPT